MKKCFFVIFAILLSHTIMAQNGVTPSLFAHSDSAKVTLWVDSVFNQMSLDERIGQTITAVITGDNTDSNKAKIIDLVKTQHIGGILFSKGTPTNQLELTNTAQSAATVPLIISLDGEWGLSMRLKNTTRFPRNMMLGAIQGNDSLLYYYGQEIARQCKLMGIHVNFGPDMDVNSNPANPVIGTRSYGADPKRVAALGTLYSHGVEDGGVMVVAKHFPGHGDAAADSHKTLPLISGNKARLDTVELYPFKKYINDGFSGMMIAHLNVPALDSTDEPSSLSKQIVTDLLKKELGFRGLVFTDGLQMMGVAKEKEMSVRALLAGNDILLGPIDPANEFDSLKLAVTDGRLSEELINEKCKKILTYKYILGATTKPIENPNLLDSLNTPYAEWLARELNKKAITLLKNTNDILPLKNLDKRKIAVVSIGATGTDFLKGLKRYTNVTGFNVKSSASLLKLKSSLASYTTIILAFHSNEGYKNDAIQAICAGKQRIMVFFTTPYRMSSYIPSINNADAVIEAYENSPFAQDYASQAIFGGNAMEGRLPVNVIGLYKIGDGLGADKTRLSYGVPEDVNIETHRLDSIAVIAQRGVDSLAFPGCQILVAKNGVIIYNKSFGTFNYNDKDSVTNETIYDLASMTKASATLPAVMKLFDQKKIKLIDPLSTYVAALKNTNKSKIIVREALFHETGLPSMIAFYMKAVDMDSFSGRMFNRERTPIYSALLGAGTWGRGDIKFKSDMVSSQKNGKFDLPIAKNMYINESFKDTIVAEIAAVKLKKKIYRYSDLNFMLLKEVVENVSKTDLNTFVQKNFYERLGATSTTYLPLQKFDKSRIAPTEQDDFLRKQHLQGYVHDESAAFDGGISGNAGLFSDANDLAKLYQMWLNGGIYGGERYLSKNTCRIFTTVKSPNSRRGLGFDKPDIRPNKVNPCSPSAPLSVYGHTGFTGTCFWVDPDNQLIYIFLSNRVNPSRTYTNLMKLSIRPRIQEIIYKSIKNN